MFTLTTKTWLTMALARARTSSWAAVGGGGHDRVEDHFGAHPGQVAGDLREPGVVADREADPAGPGQVEDDEPFPGT